MLEFRIPEREGDLVKVAEQKVDPIVVQLDEITPVACPCGQARRSLTDQTEIPLSIHLTDIDKTAQSHRHQRTTEVYIVLKCSEDAVLEVDGESIPLQPLKMVVIPPKSIHRLVGTAQILLIANPPFDPADEELIE